jgi:hypothetical protein
VTVEYNATNEEKVNALRQRQDEIRDRLREKSWGELSLDQFRVAPYRFKYFEDSGVAINREPRGEALTL